MKRSLAAGMHLEYIPPDRPHYGVFGEIVRTTRESIVVRRYWHRNSGETTLDGSIVLRLVKYADGSHVPEPLTSQWTPLQKYRIIATAFARAMGG